MERWRGRVALVTGASSGIGRAIATRLAEHGMKVVACARRVERLEEMSVAHSRSSADGAIIAMKCDLQNEDDIMAMFDRIRKEFGGVDVCVNNAGINKNASLLTGTTDKWKDMMNLNLLALCICTREAVKSMKERGIDDGAIINIGSINGHGDLGEKYQRDVTSVYTTTKHAVRSMSQALGNELRSSNSGIRITEISPGIVKTEMAELSVGKEASDLLFGSIAYMEPEDIADSVVYALSVPHRAQVSEIIIRTTAGLKLGAQENTT